MKFTRTLIKKAWQIRKIQAAKFNCPVMEIMWGGCLQMAKEFYVKQHAESGLVVGSYVFNPANNQGGYITKIEKGMLHFDNGQSVKAAQIARFVELNKLAVK